MKQINEVELSTTLAHNATRDELMQKNIINDEEEMWQRVDDESGEQQYKDSVQYIFNSWFDYFLNEINKCEVPYGNCEVPDDEEPDDTTSDD